MFLSLTHYMCVVLVLQGHNGPKEVLCTIPFIIIIILFIHVFSRYINTIVSQIPTIFRTASCYKDLRE